MKQAKTLKSDELKLVLAYIAVRRHAARNRTIVLASFLSGMRAHELASLKIGDVVDEDGRIRNEIVLSPAQTKGGRARRVFVNAKLKRELAAYVKTACATKPLRSPQPVTPKRRALSPNTMHQRLLNIYRRCGIKGASSQSGSRTFITNPASKSVSVRVLAELTGHRSIASTQRYEKA